MNTVDFIWNGQTLHLLLNGAALFDIFDRYGSDAEILELIAGSGRKDLEATCWILAKLAEQESWPGGIWGMTGRSRLRLAA